MYVQAFKVGMRAPDDGSEAARLLDAGAFGAEHVVAVLGKTEGNGGVNDFTRALATRSFRMLIAERSGRKLEDVARHVPIIWSGGTEGVMGPHATIFTREPDRGAPRGQKRFTVGTAYTRDLLPEEFGTAVHARVAADGVRAAIKEAGIETAADIHFVQIKTGALTTERVNEAKTRGRSVVTADTYGSMAYGRAAAAGAVRERLRRAGSTSEGWLAERDRSRLVNVFAKCEPDRSGATRGRRHTMFEDSDINYTRHIRGVVNAVIASVTGDTMCYVSAGAEHQGPPSGGVVAILVKT